jgi:hypothetical protein
MFRMSNKRPKNGYKCINKDKEWRKRSKVMKMMNDE